MDLFALPGIIKQSLWQLDFPYLHTVMALHERHTDVSMHGIIEISSIPKCIKEHIILYFKKSKQGINSKVSFRTSTTAFGCTILTFHTYFT